MPACQPPEPDSQLVGECAGPISGNGFRTYIHPPDSMIGVSKADGMRARYREHSRAWDVVVLVR